MKPDVLDVLLYVFENYTEEVDVDDRRALDQAAVVTESSRGKGGHGQSAEPLDIEILNAELANAGFPEPVVGKAVEWLGVLCEQQHLLNTRATGQPGSTNHTTRYYLSEEWQKLGEDGVAVLNDFHDQGILTTELRELLIERVMALDIPEIALDQLEWLALLVLSNQPDQAESYSRLEALLHSEQFVALH